MLKPEVLMLKPVVRIMRGSGIALLLLLASASAGLAQRFTITTVAGGAPPSTPVAAASAAIGRPSRVAVDTSGNLYLSASNCVFRMSSAGVLTLIAGTSRPGFSGDGGPAVSAQLNDPQGMAIDSAGNVYIADSGNNRIRLVSSKGIITTIAGTGDSSPTGDPNTFNDGGLATAALLKLPGGVAVDSAGNVYIADTGDNLIRKINTSGIINIIAGSGYAAYKGDNPSDDDCVKNDDCKTSYMETVPDHLAATSAELDTPQDVFVDSSGNLLVTDYKNAYVRKITTDGNIWRFAGVYSSSTAYSKGAVGSTNDGYQATTAAIEYPMSVTVDSAGNVYFAEFGDSRVRKVDTKGIITTVAGIGTPGFTGDGSDATKAALSSPTGVAVDSSGNLYIADSVNLRVRKVASGTITTVVGNGLYSYSGDGGAGTSAQLQSPQGVAADASGNLYIADTGNHVVRKLAVNGTITNFAGTGTAGSAGDGSAATSAQLNTPMGLAVDSAGNVYIADTQNARVRKVSTSGTISTVAGTGTPGYSGDGGSATAAALNVPIAVAVDSSNNLYIADFSNNRIRQVTSGGVISTVAGTGLASYSGDGGQAVSAAISTPQGVAVDSSGTLYIADSGNGYVRRVVGGVISTVAKLANVTGVAVDSVGDVYVADSSARVRVIYPNGTMATAAGTGTVGYSGDGGSATSATLNQPFAVALGSDYKVYVADTGNKAIRLLQFSGVGVSIAALANGASNVAGAVAPGEVVVIYGSGLGPDELVGYTLNKSGMVGTTLSDTTVYFNGTAAPLLYTSANQVGAVVPYGIAGSSARVFVMYQGEPSTAITVSIATTSPALFTLNGSGPVLALNADGSVNGSAHPAKAGTYVTMYGTGFGQTNPSGVDGQINAVPLPLPLITPTATIGGKDATVQYYGGAPLSVAGVMQVNLLVPSGLSAGAVPVILNFNGTLTPASVTLVVAGN